MSGSDVNNPVAFIGQAVLGATVGAPLSTDSNGQLVSGITATKVSATADATTTSTTDVLITSMTITPVSGTYEVKFSTTVESNSNNANIFVSLYAGGSQTSGTEMSATPQIQGGLTPSLNMRLPISTVTQVAVNGSQAIEARWRITAGTATSHSRTLSIIRVL